MLARGSATLVLLPLVATAGCLAVALLIESPVLLYAGLPLGILFLFLFLFFRDPERTPGRGIVSPADGRVIEADAERRRLTVFMGVLNVHVNRAPWTGRIAAMLRSRGGNAPAYRADAARNERLETVLATALGEFRMTQVVGMFARRIVPYRRAGDRVRKGQRIGMIRFGSRVELALPEGVRLVVRVGARVRAGETTVAEVVRGPVR